MRNWQREIVQSTRFLTGLSGDDTYLTLALLQNKTCCCSVTQSCLTLCHPMPGLSFPHHLLKFAQVHVHWIGDAIQPSHPLLPSSPSALNLSQHQGIFQWVSCSHKMTKILELQLQHQSFQWIFRIDFFYNWLADLLAVQGTLKSLLQHHSLKASILWSTLWEINAILRMKI